jgi:hypothetical protein
MSLLPLAAAAMFVLPLVAVNAQGIPRSVAAAEADGAAFGHARTALQSSVAAPPFSGTRERRCVAPPADDSLRVSSLRSGEIVARAQWSGRWGPRKGKGQKILWLPLHTAAGIEQPFVIRASRIGGADLLRQKIPRAVHSHGADGYPSNITFSSTGEWLVVATTGGDWGCFLVPVVE